MNNLNRLRLPVFVVLLSASPQGCRTPNPDVSDTYGVVTADAPENLFRMEEFSAVRTYSDAKACGHDKSGISVLKEDGPISVLNSKNYLWAMPHPGQPKYSYALQWFPKDSIRSNGGTPIIRVIPKADYRRYRETEGNNSNCDFATASGNPNRAALMFVYGVGSPGRGESIELLDYNVLNALLNFETTPNTPPPSGDNKIGRLPAYIQMVANQNTPADGPFGKHDPDAATRVAFNLNIAYEGGINEIDIVTHSNGMISSQIGYSYYAYVFMRDREAREEACKKRAVSQGVELNARAACHSQVRPMRIKFYHMQAAPDEVWTVSKKSPFPPGFYGDFAPLFEQVSKGSLSAAFSYPPDDFSSYFFNLRHHLSWEFRYYYNNGDFLTYPPTAGVGTLLLSPALYVAGSKGYSTVGINESINWVGFAVKAEKAMGKDKFRVGHYYCLRDSLSKKTCGQKHSAYHSIQDVSHPTRIKLEHWKEWLK